MTAPYIAVVGPGTRNADAELVAYQVGEFLASKGAVLICGGLGGSMEAACRGAKKEGGITIGILPGNSRTDANQYVDVALPTGMGEARNALVVRMADGVIAIGGGYGTLSEIALALKMEKPIVGIGTWQSQQEGTDLPVTEADGAKDAVEMILEML